MCVRFSLNNVFSMFSLSAPPFSSLYSLFPFVLSSRTPLSIYLKGSGRVSLHGAQPLNIQRTLEEPFKKRSISDAINSILILDQYLLDVHLNRAQSM